METARNKPWSKFWQERGRTHPAEDPIALDGWDYGISQMGPDQAEALRDLAIQQLSLTPQGKLLEVGCGAGMLLAPLSGIVASATGCDLAQSMLVRARQISPELEVQVAEANYLPYASDTFDAVLVYSVFHYFPGYEYADHVLAELYRVCRRYGRIWIGDIPDKSRQQEALSHRERLMKENVPSWPWPDLGPLEQRFYDPQFFIDFCHGAGCRYNLEQQSVEGYIQGQYRFNICIEKR